MKLRILFITAAFQFFELISFSQDTILLKPYIGNLKKLTAKILDKEYDFIFDTGGGETFVIPEIADILKKKQYGNGVSFRMDGEMIQYKKIDSVTLSLGKTIYNIESLAVWDIMSILPKELPKIYGVVSLKTFKGKIIELNLSKNQIIVHTAKSATAKKKNYELIPSVFSNGSDGNEMNLYLSLTLKYRTYNFLFDCGNLNPVILSDVITGDVGENIKQVEGSGPLLSFSLGSRKLNEPFISKKIIHDGALNYSFISKYSFIIDLEKEQVFVQ
jgi:hypothetical protein